MTVLDVVLWDDALVGDPLLIQEVRGDGLLQKRITDVLLVSQNFPERAGQPVIKAVLCEDPIPDETLIGYVTGFEKSSILENNKFIMASLMASLFKYAIVDVSNTDCSNTLRNFEKNYLTSVDSSEQIFIDPLPSEADDG